MAYEFRWNDWNINHIADHGITPGEAEYVVNNAHRPYPQRMGDRKYLVKGQTSSGEYLQVVRKMRKPKKHYWEMTTEELREATKEFDEDFAFEKGKPLTAADRKLLAKARKRGRPRVGLGAEKIRVTIERRLLKEADACAKASGISRSELIAQGLRIVLAKRKKTG